MAKKDRKPPIDYNSELRLLKERGPERLYLLWGQEDYLREQYFAQLKALCLPDGDGSFSLKRLNGPELELTSLREAVDSMPFLSERTLVELRGVDINKLPEPDEYIKVLTDIPEFCTVVFIQSAEYEFDGRLKQVKQLRAMGRELEFTAQSQGDLTRWIQRRFSAAGKSIDSYAAQRLILISGERMNALVPEIEKISAYAKGERIDIQDIDAVANHIPEAIIFEITGKIAGKEFRQAAELLQELLDNRKNEPIAMLAAIGYQMRQLYIARVAVEKKLGAKHLMDNGIVKSDYVANNLISQAKGYTLKQLERAVELCAEADYTMKSSNEDNSLLFKELFMRIASGECNAQH